MGSPERELCPPPGSEEDELTLPRASINKMIKEVVPSIRVAFESRELILNCCTEFIHLLSSEANEVCNQNNKKTINADHILTDKVLQEKLPVESWKRPAVVDLNIRTKKPTKFSCNFKAPLLEHHANTFLMQIHQRLVSATLQLHLLFTRWGVQALDRLGFSDYTMEAEAVVRDCKAVAAKRRRQSTRLENLGIPEEELLRQQQELFAKAREEQAMAEQQQWLQLQQQQGLYGSAATTIQLSATLPQGEDDDDYC